MGLRRNLQEHFTRVSFRQCFLSIFCDESSNRRKTLLHGFGGGGLHIVLNTDNMLIKL